MARRCSAAAASLTEVGIDAFDLAFELMDVVEEPRIVLHLIGVGRRGERHLHAAHDEPPEVMTRRAVVRGLRRVVLTLRPVVHGQRAVVCSQRGGSPRTTARSSYTTA